MPHGGSKSPASDARYVTFWLNAKQSQRIDRSNGNTSSFAMMPACMPTMPMSAVPNFAASGATHSNDRHFADSSNPGRGDGVVCHR